MSRFVKGKVTCAGFLRTLRFNGAKGNERRGRDFLSGGTLVSESVVGLSVPVFDSVSTTETCVVDAPVIGGLFVECGRTKRSA